MIVDLLKVRVVGYHLQRLMVFLLPSKVVGFFERLVSRLAVIHPYLCYMNWWIFFIDFIDTL